MTKSQWHERTEVYKSLGFTIFFESYPKECWGLWPKFTDNCINIAEDPEEVYGQWYLPNELPPHVFPHYAAWVLEK